MGIDNDLYIPGKNIHLKIALFGPPQVGKTHWGLTGPGPVIAYDAEGSLDLLKKVDEQRTRPLLAEQIFGFKKTTDRVADAIRALGKAMKGGYGDNCGTFVLDSWTLLENDIRSAYPFPDDPKAHHEINAKIEQGLLRAIEGSSAVHLVVTAREANEWAQNDAGQTNLKAGTTGFRPNAHKKFVHAFDLVFRISFDRQTGKRMFSVYKTRYPEMFPLGKIIPDLTWGHFEKIIRGEVKAAAPQQIDDGQSHKTDAPAAAIAAAPASTASTPAELTTAMLSKKHTEIGKPSGSLKAWLVDQKIIAPTDSQLSTDQRQAAFHALSALEGVA